MLKVAIQGNDETQEPRRAVNGLQGQGRLSGRGRQLATGYFHGQDALAAGGHDFAQHGELGHQPVGPRGGESLQFAERLAQRQAAVAQQLVVDVGGCRPAGAVGQQYVFDGGPLAQGVARRLVDPAQQVEEAPVVGVPQAGSMRR